jgi:hypothetical protein
MTDCSTYVAFLALAVRVVCKLVVVPDGDQGCAATAYFKKQEHTCKSTKEVMHNFTDILVVCLPKVLKAFIFTIVRCITVTIVLESNDFPFR